MLRFVVVALTISYVYGAPAGLALQSVPVGGLAYNHGYDAGLPFNYGYAGQVWPAKAAVAGPAIQSTQSYVVVPYARYYQAPVPQTVPRYYAPLNVQPLNVQPLSVQPTTAIWRTQSAPLNLVQVPSPAVGIRSENVTSVISPESYKPVVQEVIQPDQKFEQRLEQVVEPVPAVVAKGEENQAVPKLTEAAANPAEAPLPAPEAPLTNPVAKASDSN